MAPSLHGNINVVEKMNREKSGKVKRKWFPLKAQNDNKPITVKTTKRKFSSPQSTVNDFYCSSASGSNSSDISVCCCPTDVQISRYPNPCIVTISEMEAFFHLMEDRVIKDFLEWDNCMVFADKYLIAMVFAYFKRARLTIRQFTRLNFFLALFLAHDMEEDEEELKHNFLPWVLGSSWRQKLPQFLKKREKFWRILEHRSVVSRKCCLELMSIQPSHEVWQRERVESHAGANRQYPHKLHQYQICNMSKEREEKIQRGVCRKDVSTTKAHSCSLNSVEDTDGSTITNFHLPLSSSTSEASSFSFQSEQKTITLSDTTDTENMWIDII
ncbi:uncharacterized protein LOC143227268 [Tachypleus tridentatus]|uniref:uncharacterized protein LOC143227268 n=1 Tax=Tachypleus tridentatus TaxID=6853 RepID=UPI003FD05936